MEPLQSSTTARPAVEPGFFVRALMSTRVCDRFDVVSQGRNNILRSVGHFPDLLLMHAPGRCSSNPKRIAMSMMDDAALLSEKDAARLLSMSHRTLQAWRSAGLGPPYIKLGRSIRYPKGELLAWIESHR